MQDQTPPLLSVDEFNRKVKSWTLRTRSRFKSNAPVGTGKDSTTRAAKKLSMSIHSRTKSKQGPIYKIGFQFERHGVFVHYGVGRGYIRQGGAVVRGSHKNEKVDRTTGFKRRPNDWFDVEVRRGMKELADITQQYYGDWAMEKILEQLENKALIQKK